MQNDANFGIGIPALGRPSLETAMRSITLTVMAFLATFLSLAPAQSQDGCFGTVFGLSRNYNPSTGSGFLALREGPTSEAVQSGELFNGDVVKIVGRNGSWFRVVVSDGRTGWVFRQYVSQACGL
jgi:uncharacterized protein YgiM (DUF1202 family)